MPIGTIQDAERLAAKMAAEKWRKVTDRFEASETWAPFNSVENAALLVRNITQNPVASNYEALEARFYELVEDGVLRKVGEHSAHTNEVAQADQAERVRQGQLAVFAANYEKLSSYDLSIKKRNPEFIAKVEECIGLGLIK